MPQARFQAELAERIGFEHALVGNVVHCEQCASGGPFGVVLIQRVHVRGQQGALPVVGMNQFRDPVEVPACGEHGAGEEDKALVVVGPVLACVRIAV